jgi:hypothetical protein
MESSIPLDISMLEQRNYLSCNGNVRRKIAEVEAKVTASAKELTGKSRDTWRTM